MYCNAPCEGGEFRARKGFGRDLKRDASGEEQHPEPPGGAAATWGRLAVLHASRWLRRVGVSEA